MSAVLQQRSVAGTTTGTERLVTPVKPISTADGDLLVAWLSVRLPTSPTELLITPPTGWNLVGQIVDPTTNDTVHEIYFKIANSEPASWTWNWDQDQHGTIAVGRITGHDGTDQSVLVLTPSGTNHESGDMTLTQDDMLIIGEWVVEAGSGSWTEPAGFTSRNIHNTPGGTEGLTALLADKVQAVKGSTGKHTGVSTVSGKGVVSLIAIKDVTVTETFDISTGIKTNVVNGVDAQAGVEVLSGDVGARQGLRRLFVNCAGTVAVRIEDTAGKILFPEVTFPTAGGHIGPLDFEKGRFTGGIGLAINVKSDSVEVVSVQIESDVIQV